MHIIIKNKSYSTMAFSQWELLDDKIIFKSEEFPLDSLVFEARKEPGLGCGFYQFWSEAKKKRIALGFGNKELDAAHEAFEYIQSHLGEKETARQNAIAATENQIDVLCNSPATKKIGNYVWFNDDYQQFAVLKTNLFGTKIVAGGIFPYSDILDYELIENGNSIAKGGLGRALVGAALFGAAGAVVGGVTGGKKSTDTLTELKIKVTLKDTSTPLVWIEFASGEIQNQALINSLYDAAQTAMSMFNIICEKAKVESNGQISSADEIRKYKSLLDDGIITQDEFEQKKKALLGL